MEQQQVSQSIPVDSQDSGQCTTADTKENGEAQYRRVWFWNSWYCIAMLVGQGLLFYYIPLLIGYSDSAWNILQFIGFNLENFAFILALRWLFETEPKIIFK